MKQISQNGSKPSNSTGKAPIYRSTFRYLCGIIALGTFPALPAHYSTDLAPVDQVALDIVTMSQDKENFGKIFGIQTYIITYKEIHEQVHAFGYRLHEISYGDWLNELKCQKDNPLFPLLPLLEKMEFFDNGNSTKCKRADPLVIHHNLMCLVNRRLVFPPPRQND